MTDPRDMLTEETPESPEDFKKRQLTEVGGSARQPGAAWSWSAWCTTQADPKPRVLTEDLPEEEEPGPETLLG